MYIHMYVCMYLRMSCMYGIHVYASIIYFLTAYNMMYVRMYVITCVQCVCVCVCVCVYIWTDFYSI